MNANYQLKPTQINHQKADDNLNANWNGRATEITKITMISKINLRLILVSGKTKEFVFSPVDSAGDIAVHVYDNWPEGTDTEIGSMVTPHYVNIDRDATQPVPDYRFVADWASECVSRAEILRLIYQGRFLHSSVTLGALGLPLGRTTVMHLVPREHLPEPNSHDQRQKSKGGSSSCCSASCCIL
ncbi:Ubiquitin-like protein 3 [Papilio machaon]|uniref:Ubiquitin-like protein 3 n=1 Tax=Papilio machaon TaxID=76193 RepID=A0A0N1IHU2_PAPMA|nr:Ubiquitin-like protein 3 [Papilio machaon]